MKDGGWHQIGVEPPPSACHVLAAYFDQDVGEWVMDFKMSPPPAPYTFWRVFDPPGEGEPFMNMPPTAAFDHEYMPTIVDIASELAIWVEGALQCPTWHWSADQAQAAQFALDRWENLKAEAHKLLCQDEGCEHYGTAHVCLSSHEYRPRIPDTGFCAECSNHKHNPIHTTLEHSGII